MQRPTPTDRRFAIATLALAIALLLAGCNGDGAVDASPPEWVDLMADAVEIRAEIAADPMSRRDGLMFREALEPNSGMLFIFPEARRRSFWMLNVPIALSIAFLGDDGTILEVHEMAPGAGIPIEQQPAYASRASVRYALEMEGGWFGAQGLAAGDRIDLGRAMEIIPR